MFSEITPLLKEHKVLFAYLFGSQAKQTANQNSDVDIAVYFEEENKFKHFEKRLLLMSKISALLKKEVEIVVLNDIKNTYLLRDILYEGQIIFNEDPNLHFHFETSKKHEVIDYLNHLKYATSIEQVAIKISKIRDYLKLLKQFKKYSAEELKNNTLTRGALERFLYLACDSLISLLEMYISYKKYPKAENYAENIEILSEKQEITKQQGDILHKIISFRNILTHDYEKLDFEIIKNVLDNHLSDIEKIVSLIEKKL